MIRPWHRPAVALYLLAVAGAIGFLLAVLLSMDPVGNGGGL